MCTDLVFFHNFFENYPDPYDFEAFISKLASIDSKRMKFYDFSFHLFIVFQNSIRGIIIWS